MSLLILTAFVTPEGTIEIEPYRKNDLDRVPKKLTVHRIAYDISPAFTASKLQSYVAGAHAAHDPNEMIFELGGFSMSSEYDWQSSAVTLARTAHGKHKADMRRARRAETAITDKFANEIGLS